MADNLKDLPAIPDTTDPKLKNALDRIREAVQVLRSNRGDSLDAAITWRSAFANGLAKLKGGSVANGASLSSGVVIPGSAPYVPDLTPPPTVTSLTASAAISHVIVEFDAPAYTQGHGNARTDVYAVQRDPASVAPLPVFTDAAIVSSAPGNSVIVAIPSNPDTKWFIWAKYVSVDGVSSTAPAGGTNGVTVTTGQDVTTLLNALTLAAEDVSSPYSKIAFRADLFYIGDAAGTFSSVPFYVTTTSFVQNGVTVPPGVYMTNAYMANGTIVNAMIGNAQIDDAKITTLSVAKLLAGSIGVGEYIQSTGYVAGSSGWKISGSGVAEFSGVIVRGTIVASGGSIGGATIASTYVQSVSYVAGSAGWKLDNASGIVYAASLHVQDGTGTRIINTDAAGTAYVLQSGTSFWVKANGDAYFGGKLAVGAASLTAASGSTGFTSVSGSSVSSLSPGNLVVIASGVITNTGADVTYSVQTNVLCQASTGVIFSVVMAPTLDGSVPAGVYLDPACVVPSGETPIGSNSAEVQMAGTWRFPVASGTHSYGVLVTVHTYSPTSGTLPVSPISTNLSVYATGVSQENVA